MAKSAKERMAEYRRRKRENPQAYEQYKAAERERYYKRKAKGEIKTIDQLSERGQRKCRRRWVKAKKESRERMKIVERRLTPPSTPERSFEEVYQVNEQNEQMRSQAMRASHQRRRHNQRAACYHMNNKLKIKLQAQERLAEKYKKRYNRLKSKFTKDTRHEPEIPLLSQKSYLLYSTLISNIRSWYKRNTGRLDKRKVADVIIAKRLLKRYGLGAYCSTTLGVSRRYIQVYGKKVKPVQKTGMKERVTTFLSRDDNSRMKADKNATITRNGEKRQIRLLTDDLKTLHNKYKLEGNKISYSLFCRFRPFWVVRPTDKDRNTCQCKIHENLTLKIKFCYAENLINSKDPNVLIKNITCDMNSKKCMYRECLDCVNRKIAGESLEGSQVSWFEWTNKRIEGPNQKTITINLKDKKQGSKEVLFEELNKDLQRSCRHIFNIKHQYEALAALKEQIRRSETEALVHIDFSENYNTKYESEIQSMHFGASKRQISLHTGVSYIGDETISFCSVSDCLRHGPAAIWAHLEPVVRYIREIKPITKIHFLSDGPTTQYRNKMNFFLWTKNVFEYGFESSSWNFFEASHGKGAADGVGAAIKRAADHQVNVRGRDITNAKDMIEVIQQSTKVKLFLIDEAEIEKYDKLIPSDLATISGTMKIHQLYTTRKFEISWRVLSCFCKHPSTCECFDPAVVFFPADEINETPMTDGNQDTIAQSPVTTNVSECVADTSKSPGVTLKKVLCVDEYLKGKYVVVRYDGLPFPGIVLDVDEEDLEVKVMHRVGINRYFWPRQDDQCWYTKEDVLTVLEKEPDQVTARHRQIPHKVWELVQRELDI